MLCGQTISKNQIFRSEYSVNHRIMIFLKYYNKRLAGRNKSMSNFLEFSTLKNLVFQLLNNKTNAIDHCTMLLLQCSPIIIHCCSNFIG
jgi:hypothetical protein